MIAAAAETQGVRRQYRSVRGTRYDRGHVVIWIKTLLLIVLTFFPMIPAVLARPWISTAAVVGLLGYWIVDPSWGAWVYTGVCMNLLQWRAWQLHLRKLRMSLYVSSPSMAIQNSTSGKAAIGAVIGAIRSGIAGDVPGTCLGVVIAALLFGLQGILFPNPSVVAEACGQPFVTDEELARLLERTDYPTLLRFNRLARKNDLSGPILAAELANFLERERR